LLQETDSITDQSSQSKSAKSTTQFSVQRSDINGLRMKISAIRNPPPATSFQVENLEAKKLNTKEVIATATAAESSRKKLTKVRKMSEAQEPSGVCSTEAKDMNKNQIKDAVLSTVNTTKKIKFKRKKIAQKSCNINNNINNNTSDREPTPMLSAITFIDSADMLEP